MSKIEKMKPKVVSKLYFIKSLITPTFYPDLFKGIDSINITEDAVVILVNSKEAYDRTFKIVNDKFKKEKDLIKVKL